jgi:hypothetical protein
LLIVAQLFAIPVSVFPLVSLNLGLGLHIWDLKPEWHVPYSKVRTSKAIVIRSQY